MSLNKCPNESPDRSRDAPYRGLALMKMSQSLINYLSNMNSTETQWSIYVNPENLDEYECTQWDGQSGWVKIGTPDSLSFGFQSNSECLEDWLLSRDHIEYKSKKVKFNRKGILEAYSQGTLDEDFKEFLLDAIEDYKAESAKAEAEFFVIDTIPDLIAAQSVE
jgi:hypothetical protein